MSASENRHRAFSVLGGLALVGLMASTTAGAQQNSREQEQLRRMRQQLQQLQQQQTDAQQSLQKAQDEKLQLAAKLEAAENEWRRAKAQWAAKAQKDSETQKELQELQARHTQLQGEIEVLTTEAQAAQRVQQQQRIDLTGLQRQVELRDAALGDLRNRHTLQAQGLQTCVANNQSLVKLGHELLQRYADKGIGEVFAQNESFLQFQRVALENLLQGYQDKLDTLALKAAGAKESGRAP